jgi:adenylate cyclase
VSEFTYERLRGTYRARKLDRIVVKGKTQPVAIYEILEHHGESSYPNLAEALGIFRDAMRQYRQREFAAAAGLFEKVVAINPQDRAAALYVERCARLGANPPPSDWDGVWRLEAK